MEELLFIFDDIRSHTSALRLQKGELQRIADHFDQKGQKGLAHFARKKAVQTEKSEELAAQLDALINETLSKEDLRAAVDQVVRAYQSQLHIIA